MGIDTTIRTYADVAQGLWLIAKETNLSLDELLLGGDNEVNKNKPLMKMMTGSVVMLKDPGQKFNHNIQGFPRFSWTRTRDSSLADENATSDPSYNHKKHLVYPKIVYGVIRKIWIEHVNVSTLLPPGKKKASLRDGSDVVHRLCRVKIQLIDRNGNLYNKIIQVQGGGGDTYADLRQEYYIKTDGDELFTLRPERHRLHCDGCSGICAKRQRKGAKKSKEEERVRSLHSKRALARSPSLRAVQAVRHGFSQLFVGTSRFSSSST